MQVTAAPDGSGGDPLERLERDSVARALTVIGDSWVFLILRELFFGVRRFDAIQRNIGAAPNILTGRLKKLALAGLVERVPYSQRPPRFEYRLTPKGVDLYPTVVLIMRWGDKWYDDGKGPPLQLVHKHCGKVTLPLCVCDQCGVELKARDISWRTTADVHRDAKKYI